MPTTEQKIDNDQGLATWILSANQGDVCRYHSGFLAVDADPETSKLAQTDRTKLAKLAAFARSMWNDGFLLLVQRRIGSGTFDYLAVRSSSAAREEAIQPTAIAA